MAVGALEMAALAVRRQSLNAELDAFLRDEYRGRMPRTTFLALNVRGDGKPLASRIGGAFGGLVRAVQAGWQRKARRVADGSVAGARAAEAEADGE